jgi:hypothetical protein
LWAIYYERTTERSHGNILGDLGNVLNKQNHMHHKGKDLESLTLGLIYHMSSSRESPKNLKINDTSQDRTHVGILPEIEPRPIRLPYTPRSTINIPDVEVSKFSSGWNLPVISTGTGLDCDPLKSWTEIGLYTSAALLCRLKLVLSGHWSWNFAKSFVTE